MRGDHEKGRLIWTVDGENCTKYQFPPGLRDVQYSPHSAICEMDSAGVDVALMHTDHSLGRDSAYLGWCVHQYPDRLRSMAPVDEWRVLEEMDSVILELQISIHTHKLHAIKIIPHYFHVKDPQPWDDGPYQPFWQAATQLNVPIFFTLGCGPRGLRESLTQDESRAGYLEELGTLIRWMERYPDNPCTLTHGFNCRMYLQGERLEVEDEIWRPFENPNCNLEVCFPVRIGDIFEYPYRQV